MEKKEFERIINFLHTEKYLFEQWSDNIQQRQKLNIQSQILLYANRIRHIPVNILLLQFEKQSSQSMYQSFFPLHFVFNYFGKNSRPQIIFNKT